MCVCMQGLHRPEDVLFPGAGVLGCCESYHTGAKKQVQVLRKCSKGSKPHLNRDIYIMYFQQYFHFLSHPTCPSTLTSMFLKKKINEYVN